MLDKVIAENINFVTLQKKQNGRTTDNRYP